MLLSARQWRCFICRIYEDCLVLQDSSSCVGDMCLYRSECVRLECFFGCKFMCVRQVVLVYVLSWACGVGSVCVEGIGINSYLGTAVPLQLKHHTHFSTRCVWTDAMSSHKHRFAIKSQHEGVFYIYINMYFQTRRLLVVLLYKYEVIHFTSNFLL